MGVEIFDHPGFPGIIIKTNVTNPFNNLVTFIAEGARWLTHGDGLVSIPNGEKLQFGSENY